MQRRVRIQWTDRAKQSLKGLPRKVRRGLLKKADDLAAGDDPRQLGKPLTGPLAGYYSISYARYRAVYAVKEDELPNGDKFATVTVQFVLAGIRKDRDKHDIYAVALRLIELGLIELEETDDAAD